MTGLAADADLGPGGVKAVGVSVVILAHAGRVALGAHEVPILIELGPMQHVVVADVFVGIEMEPALAAVSLRPRIPGQRQRLHAPVGKLDEILLQWIEAESVFHLESRQLAVGTVGLDEELTVLLEETRVHAVIVEARIVEVAEHGLVAGVRHGIRVLRAVPERGLVAMAGGASVAADIGELRARSSRRPVPICSLPPIGAGAGQEHERRTADDGAPHHARRPGAGRCLAGALRRRLGFGTRRLRLRRLRPGAGSGTVAGQWRCIQTVFSLRSSAVP